LIPGIGIKTSLGDFKARKEIVMTRPLEEVVKNWKVGDLAAVVHKLGPKNARRLLRYNRVNVQFLDSFTTIIADLPSTKRKDITVGTYKTVEAIRRAFRQGGYELDGSASHLLDTSACMLAQREEEIALAFLSYKDLGRPDGCPYGEVCKLGVDMGYHLCEAGDGPELRVQYLDQPLHNWLVLAMKPISDSKGLPNVFDLRHGTLSLALGTEVCGPALTFPRSYLFGFRIPKAVVK
jgi:hypothetical protein